MVVVVGHSRLLEPHRGTRKSLISLNFFSFSRQSPTAAKPLRPGARTLPN